MSLSVFKTIIIITILLLLSQQAISGQLEDAFVAYKKGEVEVAQKKWLALAIKGDVRAQFFLGVLFENQPKSPENKNNSKRWLTASANNGFVPAQFNLGSHFHSGKYGPANNKMAEYWWNQAAVQGFPDAQYHLATLYYWGRRGVELNLKEAFYWFEQAAKGGHKDAMDAVLLMRGEEPLPSSIAKSPANIAYDDPRIISKLSLESVQTTQVKQQHKKMVAAPKKLNDETPESKAAPKQNGPDKELTTASKVPEEIVPKVKTAAPEQPEKEWASQQPPANYTIQLLASTSVKECENHKNRLFQAYRLAFHTQSFIKKGRKYCAVIHGSYGSYSKAKRRLNQLPRKIRQVKPWIRKMAR